MQSSKLYDFGNEVAAAVLAPANAAESGCVSLVSRAKPRTAAAVLLGCWVLAGVLLLLQ